MNIFHHIWRTPDKSEAPGECSKVEGRGEHHRLQCGPTCSIAAALPEVPPSFVGSVLLLWALLLLPDTTGVLTSRQSGLSPFTTGPSSRSSTSICKSVGEIGVSGVVLSWNRDRVRLGAGEVGGDELKVI